MLHLQGRWILLLLISFFLSSATGCAGKSEKANQPETASPEATGIQSPAISETESTSPTGVSAPPENPADKLFVFKKNGKCGYINHKGEWVIQPKYETAYPFVEGLALVTMGKKNLLIDARGAPIILPDGVTDVSTFKGGLAPVTVGGKTGFISRSGKIVTPPFLEISAKEVSLPSEGMHMVMQDSLFTFVDSTGKIIRQPGFEYALDFFEGRALVSNGGKYGYMDKSGRLVISMNYDVAWSFSEGLALVGVLSGKDFQFSFIDAAGKTVIPIPYNTVNPRFSNGLTFFGIDKEGRRKYGFIDRSGKVVIQPVYDRVEELASSSAKDFAKVVAFKVKSGDKWGLVSGNIIIEPAFSEISPFHEGLAVASADTSRKKKFGYIDTKGKWVIPPQYEGANDFSHGLAAVRKGELIGGKWGYIDATGKMVIAPQFRYAYDFLGDIALVQRENKKAIIDRTGRVVLEE